MYFAVSVGGSLTIISAVRVRQQPLTHWSMPTHAASLSPFLVPLSHPCATPLLPPFLPYPDTLSRSLPRSLTSSPSRSISLPLSVPHTASLSLSLSSSLFLSRARCSLSLYLPPDPTSPSRDVLALSLRYSRSLVLALFPLDPFAVWLACAGHRWGARSIYRTPI